MSGYLTINRDYIDNLKFKHKPELFSLWLHLVFSSYHTKDENYYVDFKYSNTFITVNRGQFVTGRLKLAEQCGISKSNIENRLKSLVMFGEISQQKFTKYRVITLLNYDIITESSQQNNNKLTTKLQQVDTKELRTKEELNNNELKPLVKNVVELFHEKLPSLQSVKKISDKRLKMFNARIKEYPEYENLENWVILFDKISKSDILLGQGKFNWKMNFEWMLNPNNFLKILEGNYFNKINFNKKEVNNEAEQSWNKIIELYKKGNSHASLDSLCDKGKSFIEQQPLKLFGMFDRNEFDKYNIRKTKEKFIKYYGGDL